MPLADLLSPMIARKAVELKQQLQPAPAPLPADQQVAAWTKTQDAGYQRSGASLGARAQALAYNGSRHAAFLAQKPPSGPSAPQAFKGYLGSMGANPGQIVQPTDPVWQGGTSWTEHDKYDVAAAKRLAAAKQGEKRPAEGDKGYDPRASSDRFNAYVAGGQKLKSKDPKVTMQGHHEMFAAKNGALLPMPNPGDQASGEPVAYDEAGRPIMLAPPGPMPLGGPHANHMLMPDPGVPVAQTEGGVQLDRSGKKLGYLEMQGARSPGQPAQFADRRPGDLNLDEPKEQIMRDPFARAQLDQAYGTHLHEKDNNESSFPSYLKTLKHSDGTPYSKDERANIRQGVKVLRDIQNLEDRTKLTGT